MKRNTIIGIALLALGAVLIYFGFNATEAPTEQITEAVTGRYSDETMMYLIGGGVVGVIGLVTLFFE